MVEVGQGTVLIRMKAPLETRVSPSDHRVANEPGPPLVLQRNSMED